MTAGDRNSGRIDELASAPKLRPRCSHGANRSAEVEAGGIVARVTVLVRGGTLAAA